MNNNITNRQIKEVRDQLSENPELRATAMEFQRLYKANPRLATEAQRMDNLLANKSVRDIRTGRNVREKSWQGLLRNVKGQ
jgi:hypothetical protein